MVKKSLSGERVALVFSNLHFSVGIKRLLADDNQMTFYVSCGSGAAEIQRIKSFKPDVVLTDFFMLYNKLEPLCNEDGLKIVLFDTQCGENNIIHAVMTKKIRGLINHDDDPQNLGKAIKCVAGGEVWLDNKTVFNLLKEVNPVRQDNQHLLTHREKEIITLIVKGDNNKKIAKELFISEPTVKTHLHNIFRKLNVKNRLQLLNIALKSTDITGMSTAKA